MVDGEGLQPRFGDVRIDVAEAVGKLSGLSFYFSKGTFDSIPIPMRDVSESEAESVEGAVEPRASIDEEGGVVHLVFLAEFVEKHPGGDGGSRRKESNVKQVIRVGIDGGEQPELLVVDPNHRLVDRDLIWRSSICGLLVGLLDPLLDRGPMPLDAERIKNRDDIRE